MKPHIYLTSIDRRWKQELSRATGKVILLSPYLSSPTAERIIQCVPPSRCELYTRFSVEDFVSGGSSLRTLKRLLEAGYPVYELDRLHAKLVLASHGFASIGSQNLTSNGIANREATVLFTDPEDVKRLENLVLRWLSHRRVITIEMVTDLMERIVPARKSFREAKKATEGLETEIRHREEMRQAARREAQQRHLEIVQRARKALADIMPNGMVSEELARRVVRNSTWWHTHRSGRPVRAPSHARRVYGSDSDWKLNLGGNTFLVGRAIQRCRATLDTFLADCEVGKPCSLQVLTQHLRRAVQGAVANGKGEEYRGYYPLRGNDMMFGSTSIDVNDVVREILQPIPDQLLLG